LSLKCFFIQKSVNADLSAGFLTTKYFYMYNDAVQGLHIRR
jgi:hypothetical protein